MLGYEAGAGMATRWLVVEAGQDFLSITKRLHHLLHGEPGDGGELAERERGPCEELLRSEARELDSRIGPGGRGPVGHAEGPGGVIRAFETVAPATEAHLILAGPAPDSVADDPKQGAVFDDVARMWKSRPTIASRVGGIQDQIEHGRSGLLVDDPTDLSTLAHLLTAVLGDGQGALTIGREAHRRVRDRFLAPRGLGQMAELIVSLLDRLRLILCRPSSRARDPRAGPGSVPRDRDP
jgi:hypothetical protein